MKIRWRRLRSLPVLLLLATLLGITAMPASAGLRRWTPIGPGGGYINDLAIEPASPQVVWAAGALGLYRSEDSGNTWSQRVGGFPHSFQQVEVDPSRPGVVFAGGNELLRSTDGGLSWTVLPLPSSVSVLTVVPGNGGDATLYAGYPGEIFRSSDDGDTWSSFFQGTQTRRCWSIPTTRRRSTSPPPPECPRASTAGRPGIRGISSSAEPS
jgi:photosystem II stability/assembly factor-like uncharacterized protein